MPGRYLPGVGQKKNKGMSVTTSLFLYRSPFLELCSRQRRNTIPTKNYTIEERMDEKRNRDYRTC